jgi:hypothetical protein
MKILKYLLPATGRRIKSAGSYLFETASRKPFHYCGFLAIVYLEFFLSNNFAPNAPLTVFASCILLLRIIKSPKENDFYLLGYTLVLGFFVAFNFPISFQNHGNKILNMLHVCVLAIGFTPSLRFHNSKRLTLNDSSDGPSK